MTVYLSPAFAEEFARLNFDPHFPFVDSRIVCWRSLPDRQNCTLDISPGVRWHIKRYPASRKFHQPTALLEARGLHLLHDRGIATMDCVSWGVLDDGRSYMITSDLAEFQPGDQLLKTGFDPSTLLPDIARLAARIHSGGLHHRDLYLCHFFVRTDLAALDIRLIDVARVRHLPAFFKARWIVKDLSQFWYSTLSTPVSDEHRDEWLRIYCQSFPRYRYNSLRARILAKVSRIAAHDLKLNRRQPTRHQSIPAR